MNLRPLTHLPVEDRVTIYREVAVAVSAVWPGAQVALCKETHCVRRESGLTGAACNCLA